MCKKTLREECEVFTVSCSTNSDRKTTAYDLCSSCAGRVEKFIKRGLEPVNVPNEPRKTCNTCVHFMVAKSRCMKKQIQIHENDRDACKDWDEVKRCTNCRDAGWCDGEGICTSSKGVFVGDNGHCSKWES